MLFERSGLHWFTLRGISVAVSMWYMLLMAFIVFSPVFFGGGSGAIISGLIFCRGRHDFFARARIWSRRGFQTL